jgi:dipeptidyl aminopeptidase/acylaminoacyl peptidase
MKRTFRNFLYMSIILFGGACVPPVPDLNATATQDALNSAATQTATPQIVLTPTSTTTPLPSPMPSETGTTTPTQPSVMEQQFLAYVNNGQLLVTDVTNGVQGGTTQYTLEGESDQVTDLVWSPSGEYVAFVSTAQGEPHLFYIFALGQSSPTDLGPGSSPDWSSDSQSLAYISGTYPDDNIWVTTIENPAPRQLTFESNYAWGRPVFTPDAQSLVVTGTDRNNMGAQGNTTFTLESLALDGSGMRTPLPGTTPFEGGRLPYDLRFSPDGTRLAFSSSFHLSACASPGAYFVSNADGSNRQELISPSLKVAMDPNQERYHMGFSFAWNPTSDALVAHGNVVDCDFNSPTVGQSVAGPQMSLLRLDGSEQVIIPGFFYDISMDRTGTLIAATHSTDIQDLNPLVEIYSAQTGQLILSLGPGRNPQFQP